MALTYQADAVGGPEFVENGLAIQCLVLVRVRVLHREAQSHAMEENSPRE